MLAETGDPREYVSFKRALSSPNFDIQLIAAGGSAQGTDRDSTDH